MESSTCEGSRSLPGWFDCVSRAFGDFRGLPGTFQIVPVWSSGFPRFASQGRFRVWFLEGSGTASFARGFGTHKEGPKVPEKSARKDRKEEEGRRKGQADTIDVFKQSCQKATPLGPGSR